MSGNGMGSSTNVSSSSSVRNSVFHNSLSQAESGNVQNNYVLADISNRGLNYIKPDIAKSKTVTSPKKNLATEVNAETLAVVANNLSMMKFDESPVKKSPEKAFLDNLEKYLLGREPDAQPKTENARASNSLNENISSTSPAKASSCVAISSSRNNTLSMSSSSTQPASKPEDKRTNKLYSEVNVLPKFENGKL